MSGLIITGFDGNGITLSSAGGNTLSGNFIGTTPAGTAASGNALDGIGIVNSPNNIVGGTTLAARNLISGNLRNGVFISGTLSTGNTVAGNLVGTNTAGSGALGNVNVGVLIGDSANNIIGGATAAARNIISANAGGVAIEFPGATGNIVRGNYVGTDAGGTTDLGNNIGVRVGGGATGNTVGGTAAGQGNVISGNDASGVAVDTATTSGNVVQGNFIGPQANGTSQLVGLSGVGVGINIAAAVNNQFGGTAAGAANVVAFNLGRGVLVQSGTGNSLRANSIHTNGNLGIDLNTDGVTANDAGDADTGANNLQNFPVLTSVVSSSGNTTITGTFNSTSSTNGFTLEFFKNATCDPSGNGEGQTFIGSTTVNTDASGNATVNPTFVGTVAAGEVVTATATDPNGNTSEFSPCRQLDGAQTYTVANTNDSGAGSLRQAIIDANANTGFIDTIAFNIAGGGVQTIALASALPAITDPVVIDGTTQGGYAGTPLVELNGAGAGASVSGFNITGGASTVRALVINRFTSHGILLQTGDNNVVQGCYIGTDPAGTTDLGNGGDGVHIQTASTGNQIGGLTAAPGTGAGNLISGNTGEGIEINGTTTSGNIVAGNLIGTNAAGTAALRNDSNGILLLSAPGNTIGGASAQARNVISGHNQAATDDGIEINGDPADGNIVTGNYIGTDLTGTVAIGNGGDGILVAASADNNQLGGSTATPGTAPGNLVAGNGGDGIETSGNGNLTRGNIIGLNAAGTAALGNTGAGYRLANGINNFIGGPTVDLRNLISGNGGNGVVLNEGQTAVSDNNTVQSNYIGTDIIGAVDLGNTADGININQADGLTIGGPTTTPGTPPGNVIAGNNGDGMQIGTASAGNIFGNLFGLKANGTQALPNSGQGVSLNCADTTTIGGTAANQRNIISGNTGHGVLITCGNTGNAASNAIRGNYIGTDITGTAAVPNTVGVRVEGFAPSNVVGGTAAGAGNLISGNSAQGVILGNANGFNNAATLTAVQGNFIGTQANGTSALGNGGNGVEVNAFNPATTNDTIGGTAAGAANVIAFNNGIGVRVASRLGNLISGNAIHSNTGLGIDLGTAGVTPNDAGDADTGANNLQNFPVITAANSNGVTTTVQGTLNSTASTTFTIEFFSNAACDAANNGEGRTYLGSTTVTTDASGNAVINVTLPTATAAGEVVTATATDPNDNTSEFSQCNNVVPGSIATLGNYANTSVQLSANTTITPSAAPTNTTRITVSTSTNFKGKLEGDPATGIVRVTDAHPAGTYTVTVTAFDSSGLTTTKTFTLTVTTPATCNPVSFARRPTFRVGTLLYSVAVGDFNGDGKQDLATANGGSNNVSVLLGNGAGSFSAATNFAAGA